MAREKLMKMLAKKKDLSPHEKHAKMAVVKDLKDSVSDMMGDKMDGLKKVSVASNSKEGLKKGLDKARGVLSDSEESDMQNDALAPYSDAKHAMEEHEGEEGPDSLGNSESGYDDGGQVADPEKLEEAQASMRKAFGYNEGGEIQESPDKGEYSDVEPSDENEGSEEESPDHQPEDYTQEAESPAGHEESGEDEFHGLDMDEIHEKIRKLMDLKSKMENR